jgi:hypothetical protein
VIAVQETPLAGILSREETKKHAVEHFPEQIALLRDLADYGSNLVLRVYNSSAKDLPAIIVCGVLLKQVVAMVDAIYALVEQGMVHAAHLPARAAFEASVYLDWILFGDSQRKATAYMVSNYRDERLWAARVIKGTPEEAIFDPIAKSLGLDIHARRPTLAAESQKHLAEVNRILAQTEFAKMDKEFNRVRGKKKYDPDWHEVCGLKTIRQVAGAVGRLPEYEFFYSRGSQISHSGSYKDHIRFVKDMEIHFRQIRNLEGVDALLNFTVATVMRSFQNTLRYYRSEEVPAFTRKYINDWRIPFLTVKSVK